MGDTLLWQVGQVFGSLRPKRFDIKQTTRGMPRMIPRVAHTDASIASLRNSLHSLMQGALINALNRRSRAYLGMEINHAKPSKYKQGEVHKQLLKRIA